MTGVVTYTAKVRIEPSSPSARLILFSGSAMRFKDSQEQQSYLRHASDQGHLELIYAGLDVLSSTPWQVNRKVFDVVLEVWNSGQRAVKIPPAVYDMPEPQKPGQFESDPKAKIIYLAKQKAWSQDKASNHSDRCSVNYKIEIARTVSYFSSFRPMSLSLTC
jgi:DNA-directed RNA polymerase, mitochondrial